MSRSTSAIAHSEPLPDVAPGFQRISGTREPPDDGPFYIQLRMGFWSEKYSYTSSQLRWVHDGSAGDIIAVKRAV